VLASAKGDIEGGLVVRRGKQTEGADAVLRRLLGDVTREVTQNDSLLLTRKID
jgi:hypothetical protein